MLEHRDSNNFVDHCRNLARRRAQDLAFTWLRDGEAEEASLTFAELDSEARKIAVELEDRELRGERALLMYSPGLEFISAFLGCLYAGVVAVPMKTPRNEHAAETIFGIARHADARIRLTDSDGLDADWSRKDVLGPLEALATDTLDPRAGVNWVEGDTPPDQLAFLQYTSGSTGSPKGVQVSHRNLIRNEQMIRAGFGNDSSTIFASWLPLFHDMGLLGNILQPLFLGVHSVLMAPSAFVQKPVRWLRAMSRYKATTTGGPNFGYELCVQRVSPEQIDELDLSSWKLAYNGSEPIRAQTMEDFIEKFAPAGFRREVFYPCYGLAEASLYVTGGRHEEPIVTLDLDGDALKRNEVRSAREGDSSVQRLVGCGRAWLDQRVLIVDPDRHRVLEDDRVGEVWLQGENVTRGYRNFPADQEDPFQARLAEGEGPFLRTGDLGFLRDGELFITGRLKDLLIQHGQNYYPQDIEWAAGTSHPFFRVDFTAAFTVDTDDGERLVVVQEVHRRHGASLEAGGTVGDALRRELAGALRAAVSNSYGIHVWKVVFVRHATIPKTSSGKIQRRKCRTLWARGELAELLAKVSEAPPG